MAGRGVLVRRLEMLKVEAIARAYLTGGGLEEYREGGSVSALAQHAGEVPHRVPERVEVVDRPAPDLLRVGPGLPDRLEEAGDDGLAAPPFGGLPQQRTFGHHSAGVPQDPR